MAGKFDFKNLTPADYRNLMIQRDRLYNIIETGKTTESGNYPHPYLRNSIAKLTATTQLFVDALERRLPMDENSKIKNGGFITTDADTLWQERIGSYEYML